jgi:hypothetical protein
MSNYIRFDRQDIQTIIGLVDELGPRDGQKDERRPEEIKLFNKACSILELMQSSEEKERPSMWRDENTGRLTIQCGDKVSEPVPYNGIARLSNFFAVTDYYEGTFPTNVLLRFTHANPAERQAFMASLSANQQNPAVKKPRWKRQSEV